MQYEVKVKTVNITLAIRISKNAVLFFTFYCHLKFQLGIAMG
jgi:hypothetical protein